MWVADLREGVVGCFRVGAEMGGRFRVGAERGVAVQGKQKQKKPFHSLPSVVTWLSGAAAR